MKELLGIVVVLVMLSLVHGKKYGEICEKSNECDFKGGDCMKRTYCKKGHCKCNPDTHREVVGKDGKKSCKYVSEWLWDGEKCQLSNDKKCHFPSICQTCPKGDKNDDEYRCRSAGAMFGVSLAVFHFQWLVMFL